MEHYLKKKRELEYHEFLVLLLKMQSEVILRYYIK